ncbi:hypothetical protein HMPREF0063_10019 [Aeromicrobium marinum DSM 15272]|uniref:Tat pathway signal sequence domain protein n=1 Tax=Aeromicrobium marinum DSM 15272 TaxID=585531 RepID=E2S7L2_9ACTN|nr:hypothetical protein [Aeromicrobium marinum]EFQ84678.1 hypothetical protein HMPREF0063_10019 [Aeromicrobium marinum DSM 15272]
MRHERLRRSSAAAATALALTTLGACGTSFDAQVNQPYQAGIGADLRATDVQVLGALFVENFDGSGTFSGTLLNTTERVQDLTGFTVTDGEGTELEVSSDGGDLSLPVRRAVQLGIEDSKVFFAEDVEAGRYYTITLSFDGAADVEIRVPAVTRNDIYSTVVTPLTAPAA